MIEERQLGKGSVFGWHWLKVNMTSSSGDEPPWQLGETRVWEGTVELCKAGYHHSPTPFDGLEFAPGPILSRVEASAPLSGDACKAASQSRRLVAYRSVERELRLFACDCAERALNREREHGREPDRRSWAAVDVARQYARGGATLAELESAARSAESAAAWSAAAWSAEAAALSAAEAARSAERTWQAERFNSVMLALFE